MATVTIDGKEYDLEDFSDNAKSQLAAVRVCDQKITELQREIAIVQTARASYARGLASNLPHAEDEAKTEKSDA